MTAGPSSDRAGADGGEAESRNWRRAYLAVLGFLLLVLLALHAFSRHFTP